MENIQQQIKTYLDTYAECGYFQGAVLVSQHGQVLYKQAYGYASIEDGLPNRVDTKFRIASLSKSFTAAAVLHLIEAGKLRLEDRLSAFMPDFPEGDRITVHHLLCHSSGIPNYTAFPNFYTGMMRLPHTLEELINTFKGKPLAFEPGEGHGYSNSGYTMLAFIIQAVTGESYETYVTRHILEPLGLTNTGYDDGSTLYARARGYHLSEKIVHAAHTDMSITRGGWAMYATVEDLFQWVSALKEEGKVLGKASLERMFTRHHPFYGGYGWDVATREVGGKERAHIAHFGDVVGNVAYVSRFVEEDLVVIALSNSTWAPVEAICRNAARIALGEEVAAPVAAAESLACKVDAEMLAGEYEGKENEVFRVYEKGGTLYFSPADMDNWFVFPLYVQSESKEAIIGRTAYVDGQVRFHRNEEGRCDSVTYRNADGNEIAAKRREVSCNHSQSGSSKS